MQVVAEKTTADSFSVDAVLLQAVDHHRSGRLQDAERLYRAILESQPTQPDANHNLGVIAVQTGHVEASLALFKNALEAYPNHNQYWVSFIDALIKAGQIDNARDVLRQGRNLGLHGETVDRLDAWLAAQETSKLAAYELIRHAFNNGQYEEVEKRALNMLESNQNDAYIWKVLGATWRKMDRNRDALQAMRKGLTLMPDDAEAHANLGDVEQALGLLDEAEESFRSLVSLKPEDATGWYLLGNVCIAKGKHEEAESAYHKAISLRPDFAEAYNNLGNVQAILKKTNDAEAGFSNAIRIQPDYAEAHNNLGAILNELGRHGDAAGYCQKAIAIKPDYAEAHNNLGNAYKQMGKQDDAQACFRQAIVLKPRYVEAHHNLGNLLKAIGQMKGARDCYELAIEINPNLPECHRSLSQLKKFTREDPQLAVLHGLYKSVKKNAERAHICFALAKACEDIGEYDDAFALYEEGNFLRKKELGYSIEQDRKLFDRIRAAFDRVPAAAPEVLRDRTPILIVGMMRSGTSLVEQILASHSEVYGAGELATLDNLVRKHFLNTSGSDLEQASRMIASEYLDELSSLGDKRRYVTDKMPLNCLFLGFLLLAQPDIRIIHMNRDPVAVCWSNFRNYFPAQGLGFTHDLVDLAEFYRMYESLMQFWRERFPGRIYDLNYEKLTENQEEETRKLLEYCGLEWQEGCLEFEKKKRVVNTASAVQVRNKMYKGSSKAWRKFESHLGPLLEGLSKC